MDTKQTFGIFKKVFKAFVTGSILILIIMTIINCEDDNNFYRGIGSFQHVKFHLLENEFHSFLKKKYIPHNPRHR